MARRLNKKLLIQLLIFVGVPLALLAYAILALDIGALFGGGDPEELMAEAEELMEKEDWAEAFIRIRMAAGADSDREHPEIQFLMGKIALRQEPPQVIAARGAFENAIAADPSNLEARRELAALYVLHPLNLPEPIGRVSARTLGLDRLYALSSRFGYWSQVLPAARRAIRALKEADPDYAPVHVWDAMIELILADRETLRQEQIPHYEEAARLAVEGIEKTPQELDLYRVLARAYEKLDRPEDLEQALDLAIENNPQLAEAYAMKASRLIDLDQLDEAVAILEQGRAAAGENAGLRVTLAEAAIRRGQGDVAVDHLEKAIALEPDREAAHLRLALLYRSQGEREKAAEALARGVEANPEAVRLRVEQADLFMDEQEYEKADAILADLEDSRADAEIAYLKGKRALTEQQYRRAIVHLEEACRLGAAPRARLLLGRAYYVTGELGAAENELRQLVAQTRLTAAHRTLAEVELRLRKWDLAAQHATAVLQANAQDAEMRRLLARALLEEGRPEAALAEARTAAGDAPEDPAALVLLYEIYARQDKPAEAEAALLKAKELGEDLETVYRLLLDFYRRTGQEEKLQALAAEAREILPDALLLQGDQTPEEMVEQLRARIQEDPSRTRDRIALAALLGMLDRGDESRQLYHEVLDRAEAGSREWRRAWQQLFMSALQGRDYEVAADLIDRLKTASPDAPEVLFADPILDLVQGRLDAAIEKLTLVLQDNPSLSAAHFLLAQILLNQGKTEEAAGALRRAVETRPNLVAAHMMLGRIYLDQGNYPGAMVEAGEALRFSPRYLPALELKAAAQVGQGAWDAAAETRREIARLAPTRVDNLQALANLYMQLRKMDEAEAVLKKARELAPDDARLVLALAEFHARTGRRADADAFIEAYVAEHPDDPGALVMKANFLAEYETAEAAEPFYHQAFEANPEDIRPLLILGDQYAMRMDWPKAEAVYTDALTRFPDNALVKKRLADVYMLQMELDRAEALVEEVLEADPGDAQALIVRGRIAGRRNEIEQGRRYIEQALRINPSFGEARYWMAGLLAASDPVEAVNQLNVVGANDPSFEKAMLLRARINMRRGRASDAILDLRRLLDYRPTSLDGRRLLAQYYLQTGEPGRALDLLKELVEERPDPQLQLLYGEALYGAGRHADALAVFEAARAAQPELPAALEGEARALVQLGRTEEAEKRIYDVMARFEKEVWPRLALVRVHEMTDQLDRALEVLGNGLLQDPRWEAGYLLQAQILLRSAREGHPRKDELRARARQTIVAGTQRVPESLPLRTLLAQMALEDQRYEEARKVLEYVAREFEQRYSLLPQDLPELRPYLPGVRLYSLTYYYMGETAKALEWARKIWNLDPTDAPNANNLAWLLATEENRLDEARAIIRKVRDIVPNNPQILDTAGWIEHLRGETPRAVELLTESIRRGGNPEAHYHLGRIYEETGRLDDAAREYRQALEMGLQGEDRREAEARLQKLPQA